VKIALVRHAPTRSNVADIYMGQLDAPACASGLATAAATVFPVQELMPFDLFTSPLTRASATASCLLPHHRLVVDERLRERSLGVWEGMSHRDVRERWPEAFPGGVLDATFTAPGGERLDDFASRVGQFLRDAASRPDGNSVAITHNGWIRVAMWLFGILKVEEIFQEEQPHLAPVVFDLSAMPSPSVALR
jgi:broad specificity phosphatase PhoE